MAKRNLKFDIGKLRDFMAIYEYTSVPDNYGGTTQGWQLALETRAWKQVKNKTSQSQTQSGSFDYYKVFEFTMRDNPNFELKKDMIIYNDDALYVIKGWIPLENNPIYIKITTDTINAKEHALWDIINAQPYNSDKPNVIQDIDG
jgi:head-tail adaptor